MFFLATFSKAIHILLYFCCPFKISLLYTVHFSGSCFHGSCSHVQLRMAILAMLKDAVHNTFSTWQRWFRSSSSSIPRAAYFFAVPQPCMPLVMLCTPVCNLVCSMFHEHFYHHHWKGGGCKGGWERMTEWRAEDEERFPKLTLLLKKTGNDILRWKRFSLSALLPIIIPPISITWASTATQIRKISQNNQLSCCGRPYIRSVLRKSVW